MTERKIATIRRIDAINPIEGADAIEVATIGGWKVVVKKGEFKAGDLAVYCEIDSFIPTTIAPFLTKPGHYPKVFEGVEGEKLRTIRLRGQVSQGLLLPLTYISERLEFGTYNYGVPFDFSEGTDVSELLGILKWEAPISAQLAGMARGNFPSRIIKTDQERVQNLSKEFNNGDIGNYTYEISEKLEGSSGTYYIMDGVFGVCSRNLDLIETVGNSFWDVARRDGLEEKLRRLGYDVAIQGELIGPGIQDNIYKLTKHEFYLFDIQFVGELGYHHPNVRRTIAEELGIKHVPLIDFAAIVDLTVQEIIAMADGKSAINPGVNREGIVFKANSENRFSFKAISNAYLVKQRD